MSIYSSFFKKLQVFNVLFGAKARKLSGIQDKNNRFTDTITFTAPDTILLSFPVPAFLQVGTYFRVKNGGGANEDQLFRIKDISGNTIIVDNTTNVVSFGPAVADIDARLAVVHANSVISKLNTEGNTIFNVDNGTVTTGLNDGSGLAVLVAEHYHDDGGVQPGQSFIQSFLIGDWFVTDAGDTYSIDFAHNLGSSYPETEIFEDSPTEEIWVHKTKILDSNNVRISVCKAGADGRFSGTIRIAK